MKKAAFLIHGFASDRNDFMFFAPLLSARYDTVYCPDLPFHSHSSKKKKMNCQEVLEFAIKEYDNLSQTHDKIDIFGFSMGGAIASYIASQRETNRLILFAPSNKFFCFNYLFSRIRYSIEASNPKEIDNHIGTKKDTLEDEINAVKLFLKSLLPKYKLNNLLEFDRLIKCCNNGLTDILCPTLIVWGKLDQLVPKSSIKYLLKHCKNAKLIIYGDMSHYLLLSKAFYKILDDVLFFLEQTEPPLLNAPTAPI